MKRHIPFLVTIIVLFAGPAMALDMEFYTYGGFNPVVQAFTKVALIFGDNAYKGLLVVVTVLGTVAAAIGMIAKATVSGKISLTWPVPVLAGMAIYIALFVPTGNITVYDPTLNRFQIVGGVPDAIVFTAGTLNKLEKGLVDIIDTASAPNAQYLDKAGGIGFKALEAIRGSSPKDNHARTSMIRYIKDCVTFELLRPGSTIDLDTMRNSSTNFLTQLAGAQNPAIYTVYYDSVHPEGQSLTCTAAWNRIQPIYANPANYDEAIKRACSKAHFDPNSTVEMNTCENLIRSTMLHVTGTAQTPERLIQQRQIAEILYNFYYMDDYETSVLMEADRKIVSTGMGIGITMNEWIPIIRAIMTAVAIGTLPLLALFLPTPVIGRAASVMFGFFVFLTTWGITDAVIHGAAMDYASYAFEDVRQSNLGVYAMASFPNMSLKMLAMFGVIRSAGIMLASIFSMMLVRFGGSALAHFATNLNSIARGAGAQAGSLLTPEGNASAMAEQTRIAGLLEGMQEHRFTNMAAAGAYKMHSNVGGYHAAMNTRNALQKSGHLPQGTAATEYAQAEASANRSAGTSSGMFGVTTGLDGNASRMKGESVNTDGSVTSMTTGAGGKGVATDTLAAGTAQYHVGADGGQNLEYADVRNVNSISVGQSLQNQLIDSASTSLGGSKNWSSLTQQLQKDSLNSSSAQSYSERLNNSIRENWNRSFNDSSSFVHSMDQSTVTKFNSAVGAGFKKIELGTNGQLSIVGNDGERVHFNVSEQTAQAFARDEAKIRSQAIQDTFTNSQGLDYLTNVSRQLGVSEAYSFLSDAKRVQAATESYGANAETALVRDYAINHYGEETPANIRKTMTYLNHLAENDPSRLNRIVEGFLSGRGYGRGSTANSVRSAIDATKSRLHDDAILKGAVDHIANAAGQKASGVRPSNLTPPDSKGIREPDKTGVAKIADSLKSRNRHEETGEGRIRTTPTGMAKEGVGKVFQGVVDSQGMRPTDKGAFDYVNPVRGSKNVPPAGPIPKDAPSTLGGKDD
ncbi:conjugal transfer protein TraG N-terminal domain-containing protein [Desulfogranum marinum]|uniref:conjugal transfer protein TraG N-terminal domain-containing protein n=1 Tax=Desulfogranum marinum TaxID=453220 RepID=UPI00196547E9|nr:conjugal transfer protein TraG N-terminal domain-containing protein [Desulfogranum marinum]MBM9514074.1 conjugal transfer protein TraG N-terminal domain-containing protein [Desulfogranum marinum]